MPLPLLAGAIGKGLLGGAKTVTATKSVRQKHFLLVNTLQKNPFRATNLAQRS